MLLILYTDTTLLRPSNLTVHNNYDKKYCISINMGNNILHKESCYISDSEETIENFRFLKVLRVLHSKFKFSSNL